MDHIDRRIVDILRSNARLPLKSIAADVGLARSSARQRIARLETEGVIRGYGAIVDSTQAREVSAILSIRLKATPDRPLVETLVSRPEVVRCWSLSGEVDLLVEAQGSTVDSLNTLRDWVSSLQGVGDVTTAFVLKHEKDR